MENKSLHIAVLAGLFLGSAYLFMKNKSKQKTEPATSPVTSAKTGEFTLIAATNDNKTSETDFWIENSKYYKRCKSTIAMCTATEITKSEYDRHYNTYLN